MEINRNTFEGLERPAYILEEDRLRRNLSLISHVARAADTEIILAFKAYALWKTFPIFREYINSTTASSLYEARLAFEEFGRRAHTYSPAYVDREIEDIAKVSECLTFNSLSQFNRYKDITRQVNPSVSLGLRINPGYSEIETVLYNPCAPGTRFGVNAANMPVDLPARIDGFHCHCHCESGAEVFQRTLAHIEERFAKWFPRLKWINFGGGHLMTREDYNVALLIEVLNGFHGRYPHLKVILEPGSAFGWQAGYLLSHVVDIVEDSDIRTAILDVSFTCHMPDCLEMPYMPEVRGASIVPDDDCVARSHVYRLGGNSCLSGDYMGAWKFDHELRVGEVIVFEDMLHYTTVKTSMFNGVNHPLIGILRHNDELKILREFTYEDYKGRMD